MKNVSKICKTQSDEEIVDLIRPIKDDFVISQFWYWCHFRRQGELYYITDLDTGKVISFVLVEKYINWTIRGTWTDSDYRNRGLVKQLLLEIEHDFDTSDVKQLWVNITPGAEGLYRKLHFHIYGQRTDIDPPMSVGIYSKLSQEHELELFKHKYPKNILLM